MLLFAGVIMERPRLVSFRFGGVGGFTKAGEAGADSRSAGGSSPAIDADATARPSENVAVAVAVFTARFFKLRAFFAGVAGRWSSKNGGCIGSVYDRSVSLKRV